jgi:hypothetical protein
MFKLTIIMVWNNSVALSAFITSTSTSSTNFDVLDCVVGSPNPSRDDPSSYTILFPSANSSGNPSTNSDLLGGTCSSVGLNYSKAGFLAALFVCNSVVYKPSYVYCCCYCKCCYKCWKCFGFTVVSIQSSHTSPLKCRCSSPSKNLMSCSLLTPWLYSLSCPSYGDVICGISCLCSLTCLFYGDVICGISIVCLTTCTTISTTLTTIGIVDGSTLPFIIFCALKFVLFCSLFTLEPKAPPYSTLFFFLKTLI